MSEPGPSSIPTSSSKISNRPTKKRALTPVSQQSQQVEALFAHPDREVNIPSTSTALNRRTASLAAPPEIVTNVQGSSAGAGSGEFHVYKASRRREYERLRLMDEDVEREKAEKEFGEKKEDLKRKDEEQLAKNRAKREKAKARKVKGRKGLGVEGEIDEVGDAEVNGGPVGGAGTTTAVKKKLGPRKVGAGVDGEADGVEPANESAQTGNEMGEGITFHDED